MSRPVAVRWSPIVLLATLAVAVSGIASWADGNEEDQSLYERLGGVYPIATVVDDFIDRLLANDTLNANPAIDEARKRVPKAGLKFQVAALVCQVTGGPYEYHGRNMKDAHAHLNITEKDWDAMAADFKASLDKFEVPQAEQDALFEIVGTTKKDIVVDEPTGAKADPKAIYPPSTDKSLYGRLGGAYNIATVADDFIERLLANDTLNANPAIDKARRQVQKAGLKFQVAALICQVTGGPYEYHGRNMKEAHAHLGITEKEWIAMVADFKITLDKFGVPGAEQKELFDIVGTTHDDIVTADE